FDAASLRARRSAARRFARSIVRCTRFRTSEISMASDDALRAKPRDRVGSETEIVMEHGVGVLTEQRWRRPHCTWRVRELHRHAKHVKRPKRLVMCRCDHFSCADLRVLEELGEIANRSTWDPRAREPIDPVLPGLGAQPIRDERA